VRIYDRSGHLIRTLLDNQPSATGVFEWDGKDENGKPVKPNAYILWARTEPAGREMRMPVVIGP
jgi:flagellar hook assembly protein FlgD